MCDACNVNDEVRAEIDNISEAALNEIVRLVGDELAEKNDLMIVSILDALDLREVTLKAENVRALSEKMIFGGLKLEGDPSEDETTFTFKLKEGEGQDESLVQLMKALGLS
jgi:5,10-methylenetetrahydrofolate reductase